MPYASNAELPPAVKSSLSDKDQDQFREAFNAALTEYKDEKTAFKVAWAAVRKSADCRSFEFWANVGVVDKQGDLTDQNVLFDEIAKFVERGGQMQAQHSNHAYAAVVDHELREYSSGIMGNYCFGVVYKGDEFYDRCWDALKKGELSEFSIGGFKDPKTSTVKCDAHRCFNVLKMRLVSEISGVPKGACPQAKVTEFNAVAKSEPCPKRAKVKKQDQEEDMTNEGDQAAADGQEEEKCDKKVKKITINQDGDPYQILQDRVDFFKEHPDIPVICPGCGWKGLAKNTDGGCCYRCGGDVIVKKSGVKKGINPTLDEAYNDTRSAMVSMANLYVSIKYDERYNFNAPVAALSAQKDLESALKNMEQLESYLSAVKKDEPKPPEKAEAPKKEEPKVEEPVTNDEGPQPKTTLEDKVNQLFALVTDMAHKVDEMSTKAVEPPAAPIPPEKPAEAPEGPPGAPEAPQADTNAPPQEKPNEGEKAKADEQNKGPSPTQRIKDRVAADQAKPRPSAEQHLRDIKKGPSKYAGLSEDELKLRIAQINAAMVTGNFDEMSDEASNDLEDLNDALIMLRNAKRHPVEKQTVTTVKTTNDAVAKAAEMKASEQVRKDGMKAAVAAGIITPRPVPDEIVEKSVEDRVRGAGFGSKELMSLSYEETLRLSKQRRN